MQWEMDFAVVAFTHALVWDLTSFLFQNGNNTQCPETTQWDKTAEISVRELKSGIVSEEVQVEST
jgi:hypothetical protein